MNGDLFEIHGEREPWAEPLGPGTMLLHGFAVDAAEAIVADLRRALRGGATEAIPTPCEVPLFGVTLVLPKNYR